MNQLNLINFLVNSRTNCPRHVAKTNFNAPNGTLILVVPTIHVEMQATRGTSAFVFDTTRECQRQRARSAQTKPTKYSNCYFRAPFHHINIAYIMTK